MRRREYSIICFLFFVVVCSLFGCSSGSSEKEQAGKPSAEQARRCAEEGKDCPVPTDERRSSCTVAPGSSRSFTLTAVLPFVHSTDHTSSLDVEYEIASNDWEAGGVEARLTGFTASREEGNIWCQKLEGTDIHRVISIDGYPIATKGLKDNLLITGQPQRYREQGDMSWEEVSKIWKIEERRQKISEAEKKKGWDIRESSFEARPSAFYLATISFTVSAPSEDKLDELLKNSRFDTTTIVFRPKRVIFDDGSKKHDLTSNEMGHGNAVSLGISRKPGGGYHGIRVGVVRTGSELIRDLACE